MADGVKLEAHGIPTATICSTAFAGAARVQAAGRGFAELPIVEIPHPMHTASKALIEGRAADAAESIAKALLEGAAARGALGEDILEDRIEIDAGPVALAEFFFTHGWTDGLPVTPPTAESVAAMVAASGRAAAETIGPIPPRMRIATLEKLAVNAVMAGCRPVYFPVVLAALDAVLDENIRLYGIQTATNTSSALLIVNGPIVKELGLNARGNVFGQGNRANATIGRALQLILRNVGGDLPGETDMATHGHAGKYTFCIAENAVESPWEPYHVWKGFEPDQSAVTVFGATNPENVNDHVSGEPVGILGTMASVIATKGTNNTYYNSMEIGCIFGLEHAQIIASHGWTRTDVAYYLYEHARLPLGKLRSGGMWGMHIWPKWMDCETADDKLMPVVRDPNDFAVFVAGAKGKHSSVVKAYAANRSVTLPI